MMNSTLTFVTPQCSCCPQPQPLLPRDDLGRGLAVCAGSGQLYRPQGNAYLPTELPAIKPTRPAANSVQIDLSRSGYS